MFGFINGIIDGIFGKDSGFGSVLKTVAGVAVLGGVGYLAYKGVKAITSKKSSPTPSGKASTISSTQKPVTASSSGSNVKWDGTKWVPVVQSTSLQYCNLPSSDPRYNKFACGEGTANELDPNFIDLKSSGEDTYRSAYDAYMKSSQEGTATKEDISSQGSTWTTKLTAGDGTVLYKDAAGNIATKNEDGKWVITDSNGKYVDTKA